MTRQKSAYRNSSMPESQETDLSFGVGEPGHPSSVHPAGSSCACRGIRRVGIYAALDDTTFRDLADIMSFRRLSPRESLLMEGDRANFVYNVITGGVKLFKSLADGRTQIIGFVLPGDFLGLPMRDGYAYAAEALSDTVLCQFPRTVLQNVFAKYPALQAWLLEAVDNDLAAAQEHMLLLGRKRSPERVASFLLSLLLRTERVHGIIDPLPLPVRRHDIADFLGTTTETVSRTLTEFRKEGLIAIGKVDEVSILDRDTLTEIASGERAQSKATRDCAIACRAGGATVVRDPSAWSPRRSLQR